jgi:uncharacterized protein (DUF302 family)
LIGRDDPGSVENRLKAPAGKEGLMLFSIQEHGKLLNIVGSPRKAKKYILGNPLIAITMTRHDIRAALYAAPLRVLVYEGDDRSARIEFDQLLLSSIIRTSRPWRNLSIPNWPTCDQKS